MKNIYDDNNPAGYIHEAREWMKAEKSRQSNTRMRQSDWQWLIVRMDKALELLHEKELPDHIKPQWICEYCQETTNDPDMHRYCTEDKKAG